MHFSTVVERLLGYAESAVSILNKPTSLGLLYSEDCNTV